MSGEDYVHGINKMKKPATKVMAPPGGKTQINLFGGDEQPVPHRVNPAQAQRNQSSIFGGPEEQKPAPVKSVSNPSVPPAVSAQASATGSTSASAPASGKTSITEPPKNPTAPDGGRASTKVMAPPGGKTSINLFG